jgi:hypothetical protein
MGSTQGKILSMTVMTAGVNAAPNNQFQTAIYSDSNGSPGTLLGKSTSGTLTAWTWSTVSNIKTPTNGDVILQPNTYYWLAYNTNNGSTFNNLLYDDVGTAQSGWRSPVTFGTWPSSFGTVNRQNVVFSIYATYSPIAPAPQQDTTPPVITILSPSNGATVGASTTISATASDVSGIATIRILIDAVQVATCGATSCSYTWNTSGVSAGSHTIQVTATDNASTPNTGSTSITVYK